MRTLSCKHVIKSADDSGVQQFVPPVHRPLEKKAPAADEKKRQTGHGNPGQQQMMRSTYAAEEESQAILEKANEMAGEILRNARKEAEKMKNSALEEGFREGLEQGLREGLIKADEEQNRLAAARQEEFKNSLKEALRAVEEARDKCLRKYLDELKDCAVAVAEKVIRISLKSSGEIIKRMIIAETDKLKKTAWVKIYMEKSDYDMMMETDADIVNELTKLSNNIKFVVMEKENRGNCIIEMPEEIVDISVDTQLDNIKEILGNIRI